MPFNDWNGNGSHDHFDSYVDYKISSENSSNHDHSNSTNNDNSNRGNGRSDGETILVCMLSICMSIGSMGVLMAFSDCLLAGIPIAAVLLYGAYKVLQ